jgi:hypothetical protein
MINRGFQAHLGIQSVQEMWARFLGDTTTADVRMIVCKTGRAVVMSRMSQSGDPHLSDHLENIRWNSFSGM